MATRKNKIAEYREDIKNCLDRIEGILYSGKIYLTPEEKSEIESKVAQVRGDLIKIVKEKK